MESTFRSTVVSMHPTGNRTSSQSSDNAEDNEKRIAESRMSMVFRKARTYNAWLPKPVPDELLHQLFDTLKMGAHERNISPARFLFIRSAPAKERLRPSLAPGNVQKTMAGRSGHGHHCV